MTGKGNREKCPVCGKGISEYLSEGSAYRCPKCEHEFVLRWNKDQRDFVFVDMADKGKGEPLKMPRGSVRSLITLLLCGTLWTRIIMDNSSPSFLLDTILIVFGYYFAFRGIEFIYKGAPKVTDQDKQPLNMPKGSIRWILVAGFITALIYALVQTGSLNQDYVSFYFVLGGIILGYIMTRIKDAMKVEPPVLLKHTVAAFVLAVAALICSSVILGFHSDLPDPLIKASITVIGFYFGSR